MFAFTRPRFWALLFTRFRCHHCGSSEGYVSRPHNLVEKHFLRLLSLCPARCGDCYRRSWRPVRVRLLKRMNSVQFDAEAIVPAAPLSGGKGIQRETQAQSGPHDRIA